MFKRHIQSNLYHITMCVGYHSVIFSLHSDFLHYFHVLLANLQLNVMTWEMCFFSHPVCVTKESSLCCNCYLLQVVPGSGNILSNFIILTLENELKTDVVT